MRGEDERSGSLFSYVDLEARVVRAIHQNFDQFRGFNKIGNNIDIMNVPIDHALFPGFVSCFHK